MSYFKEEEFACPCCAGADMNPELIEMLNEARLFFGEPIVITSGRRCASHNNRVGGSKTSSHLNGTAVDISCAGSGKRMKLVCALFDAGFGRIGIAKTFIHVDVDPDKPFDVMWVY